MIDKKRILIMEDSQIFADMVISSLSSDYITELASDGLEGIKKVYNFLPHLIITDVEMPVFKGYQVTRLLKSRKNTMVIPVIMFTSMDESKDKFRGIQAGADIFLEKSPDNLPLLNEIVSEIIAKDININFDAIEREGKKINDHSVIEIMGNLLDNKLYLTTIIGMLSELAGKSKTIEEVSHEIFKLLQIICESEIVTIVVRGSKREFYSYTANFSKLTSEAADNFYDIAASDFNKIFPDFSGSVLYSKDFYKAGDNTKKIISYYTLPLLIGGEIFASVHIANTINEYFTPVIVENIKVFFNSAAPVISNTLIMQELSELQKNTRAAFASYVPADAMDEIINESANHPAASEIRNVTVLFCDIRNFTMFSEHSEAHNVVEFLNTYFALMGSEIISENGHIDKFIGDAIMAVFGAFVNIEISPVNAIRAAIKMLSSIEMMNSSGNILVNDKINIGIGINYGHCILGNIGFKNKMDYTVIGDTVNLASRIENLTKQYRHPLIVSEYVFEQSKDKFLFRKADNVRVMGKEKPVEIYAVYSGFTDDNAKGLRKGEKQDLPFVSAITINRETLINYNKGLSTFYMREWKLAQEYFKKSLETDGNDFLSKLYLERSMELAEKPPPDNWDFVFKLEQK